MRLAYLTLHWPAPTETFLAREVDGLRAAGLDLRVFALAPAAGTAHDPAASYPPTPLRPRSALDLARLALAARRPRDLRHLPTAAWLADAVRAAGCTALHAAWANLPADLAWAAQQLGAPAYTIAGHAHDVFVGQPARPAAWRAARGFVVCNRAAWRAVAAQLGPAAVTYLPHGLPLADWPPRTALPTQPLIVAVGRLVPKKGFDLLLAALARTAAPPPLVIAGEGPERAALTAQAQQLGVDLQLPGHVAPAAVRDLLHRASLLVLPSRRTPQGDRDGLANVILEAMAVGVPVLTTTAGAATDGLDHGRTGWLVAPEDVPALAAAMDRLLSDPPLTAALGARARARVEHRFNLEVNSTMLARWLRAHHAR